MICLQRVTGIAHFRLFSDQRTFVFKDASIAPLLFEVFFDKSPGGRGHTESYFTQKTQKTQKLFISRTRMGRIVRMEDIAAAISFL